MSSKLVSALLLPAGDPYATPEPLLLENGSLDQLYQLVGGHIDAVRVVVSDGDEEHEMVAVGYVNDEGILLDMDMNYLATAMFGRELFGPCVVVSGTSPEYLYDGDNYDIPQWAYEVITEGLVRRTRDAWHHMANLRFAMKVGPAIGVCTADQVADLKNEMFAVASGEMETLTPPKRSLMEALGAYASAMRFAHTQEIRSMLGDDVSDEDVEGMVDAMFLQVGSGDSPIEDLLEDLSDTELD